MQSNATVSPRLDSLDQEQFRAMLASPAFELLSSRWKLELERARLDCETQREPREIHRAQGAVLALRAVLALPGTIQEEFARVQRRV